MCSVSLKDFEENITRREQKKKKNYSWWTERFPCLQLIHQLFAEASSDVGRWPRYTGTVLRISRSRNRIQIWNFCLNHQSYLRWRSGSPCRFKILFLPFFTCIYMYVCSFQRAQKWVVAFAQHCNVSLTAEGGCGVSLRSQWTCEFWVLLWRLEISQPWCGPRPLVVISADTQFSQHEPADLCTPPSAGGKRPAQTLTCPIAGGGWKTAINTSSLHRPHNNAGWHVHLSKKKKKKKYIQLL